MHELDRLGEVSRRYGADERYVFLGGGNTSFKTERLLYIKPSGVELARIQAGDFVAMDRGRVRAILEGAMPADVWERERRVKDLMAAAVAEAGKGRPSVEAPLHEAMAGRYVVHLHPALVNGMTCAAAGAATCARLFPEALWIGYVDPGYTLARHVAEQLAKFARSGQAQPQTIFLQNHGVFVGADTLEEIERLYEQIMSKLADAYRAAGVPTELATAGRDDAAVLATAPRLRSLAAVDGRLACVQAAPAWYAPAAGPLSPDHIVYAKSYPCVGDPSTDGVAAYVGRYGYLPRVAAVPGKALFGIGVSLKTARAALVAARDAALVQQLTAAFGGPRFLAEAERAFIENWEVESYRQKVAAGAAGARRIPDKVCVVTGAAQGFGLGIARGLAAEGGIVFLADLNAEGARGAAAAINRELGADLAFGVAVNVADEASVAAMVREVVVACGGIDILIANAGVLRAGSPKTLSLADWELVTKVNYTGYFLCVKHVAPVMAAQNAAGVGPWSDIIQVNSKSGLEGSNRNAAYAGGKFGGIGLTQSFAKELVEDRIKVNSVCPGNFFDGPLWSDPEKGLFVQYLRSGKVPGAKTIADVKKSYESKVPMGRGCTPEDVLKAIFYLVDQQYETGQALPVTGGQVMLR